MQKGKLLAALRENLLAILTVGGVLAGAALGFGLRSRPEPWTPREVMYVKYIGDLFLRMLKALILPLIVSSLVAAIGSLDLTLSRKIGVRAIVYYMATTVMAVALGIILVVTIQPGKGGTPDGGFEIESQTRETTTADTLMDLVR
jgi:Na+/H+-dicarboxylate symporter